MDNLVHTSHPSGIIAAWIVAWASVSVNAQELRLILINSQQSGKLYFPAKKMAAKGCIQGNRGNHKLIERFA